MAYRGRPRTPTSIKLVRNNPGKRPIEPDLEPQPEKKKPKCPKPIVERDKIYRWAVKLLMPMGTLTVVDGLLLEGLAVQIATFRQVDKLIRDLGGNVVLKSKKTGGQYRIPHLDIRNEAWRNIMAILTEIGMTPAARTRLRIRQEAGPVNPFDAYRMKRA